MAFFFFFQSYWSVSSLTFSKLKCCQVLGAWGLGWEIWMDGMEITQFTYFQQVSYFVYWVVILRFFGWYSVTRFLRLSLLLLFSRLNFPVCDCPGINGCCRLWKWIWYMDLHIFPRNTLKNWFLRWEFPEVQKPFFFIIGITWNNVDVNHFEASGKRIDPPLFQYIGPDSYSKWADIIPFYCNFFLVSNILLNLDICLHIYIWEAVL